MNVADTLEALRNKALRDPALKKALIETRNHPNSLGGVLQDQYGGGASGI